MTNEAQFVKTLFTPVRPIHTFSFVSDISVFPEQNIRAWSGTHYLHQGPKGFTGKSQAAKQF
jgi:hypothetical protein